MSDRDLPFSPEEDAREFSQERLAESWVALCDVWDSLLDQQRMENGEPIPKYRQPGLGLSAVGDVMMAVSAVRDACMLPDLATLMAPLAALHLYGLPSEIEEQIERMRDGAKAMADLRRLPRSVGVPPAEELLLSLEKVERLLPALRLALEYIEKYGLRFDAETRQVRIITGRRGRPTRLFTAIVGSVFDHVCPPNRPTTPDEFWYSADIRHRISEVLSPLFPPDWTDPRRGGQLESRLRDYLDKRERYRLDRIIPRELRMTIPVPAHTVDALPPGLARHVTELAGQIPP